MSVYVYDSTFIDVIQEVSVTAQMMPQGTLILRNQSTKKIRPLFLFETNQDGMFLVTTTSTAAGGRRRLMLTGAGTGSLPVADGLRLVIEGQASAAVQEELAQNNDYVLAYWYWRFGKSVVG